MDFPDQCSHGKLWTEVCIDCRIVSLTESLKWMEPQVQRDRAELGELTYQAHVESMRRLAMASAPSAVGREGKQHG